MGEGCLRIALMGIDVECLKQDERRAQNARRLLRFQGGGKEEDAANARKLAGPGEIKAIELRNEVVRETKDNWQGGVKYISKAGPEDEQESFTLGVCVSNNSPFLLRGGRFAFIKAHA